MDLIAWKWQALWGARNARFNQTFLTFDLGDLHNPKAEIIAVTSSSYTTPPYVVGMFTEGSSISKDNLRYNLTLWGGSSVRALEDICNILHLICRIVDSYVMPPVIQFPGGQSLGRLMDNTARVVFTPLNADGSIPGSKTDLDVIIAAEPRAICAIIHESHMVGTQFHSGAMLSNIFDDFTWSAIGVSGFIALIVFVLAIKMSSSGKNENQSVMQNISIWFYRMLTVDFDGYFLRQKRAVMVLLFSTWVFANMVITTTLMTRLTTLLTLPSTQVPPFNTIEEIISNSKWSVKGLVSAQNSLLRSPNNTIRKLGKRMTAFPASVIRDEFFAYINANGEKNELYIMQSSSLEPLVQFIEHRFVLVFPHIHTVPTGIFWFKKNDPLFQKFSKIYARLTETGTVLRDSKYFDQNYHQIVTFDENMEKSVFQHRVPQPIEHGLLNILKLHPLSIGNFVTLFWVFVGGMLIAVAAFLCEIVFKLVKIIRCVFCLIYSYVSSLG